jgi:ubiquinone/menaquinone biosynthesis C-methylase UbiE
MSTQPNPANPHREHASTYFVQDRSNQEELSRLQVQDNMLTRGMGGVLAEQPDPTIFQRVLDVGCGSGSWLIEAARTYPTMSLLIGVDISSKMIEFAREQAKAQQVSDRVEFHIMDALRVLEFPDNYFDLVNLRLGSSYLRTWDWPKILQEFQRITRSGGTIRLTEADPGIKSRSQAHTRLAELFAQSLSRASL